MMDCPHCGKAMFSMSANGDRLKAPTSMLVLHKSGDVEINCKHCKQGVLLPLSVSTGNLRLRKASPKHRHFFVKGVDRAKDGIARDR